MQLIWDTKHKAKSIASKILKQWHSAMYGSCAVLLYHRVSEYTNDPQLLCVSPENFDKQLEFLKNNYTVLTIEEWKTNILQHKKFKSGSIVISFDDGYEDNFLHALPILEKNGTQALFYVCTGNLNTPNEFWWDELENILLLSKPVGQELSIDLNGLIKKYGTDIEQRNTLYQELLPVLRKMHPNKRSITLKQLSEQFGNPAPRASHRSMSFEQLKKMSGSNAAVIGAHTHNHPSLAALSMEEQKSEIQHSKQIVEDLLGTKIEHFSYPFGTKMDYTQGTMNLCKEAGFHLVASNYPYITHAYTDPFQVPRFLVRDWQLNEFKSAIHNFFN